MDMNTQNNELTRIDASMALNVHIDLLSTMNAVLNDLPNGWHVHIYDFDNGYWLSNGKKTIGVHYKSNRYDKKQYIELYDEVQNVRTKYEYETNLAKKIKDFLNNV